MAKDFSKAREYWEQAMCQKHADAQYNLGVLYANGYGVQQDFIKAREYWWQLVYQRHANAIAALRMLSEQTNTHRHFDRIVSRPTPRGDSGAVQNNWGSFSYDWQGVPRDVSNALEDWEPAARQEGVDAISDTESYLDNLLRVVEE